MSDTIRDALETNVTGPAAASNDAGSVTQHDPLKQIEADKYLSSRTNATARHRGMLLTKLKSPGAV
jgi:hypothetical protein